MARGSSRGLRDSNRCSASQELDLKTLDRSLEQMSHFFLTCFLAVPYGLIGGLTRSDTPRCWDERMSE